MQEYFSIKEVADMFNLSTATIRKWIYYDKTLRAYKVGGAVRIAKEDVESLKEVVR